MNPGHKCSRRFQAESGSEFCCSDVEGSSAKVEGSGFRVVAFLGAGYHRLAIDDGEGAREGERERESKQDRTKSKHRQRDADN